MKINVVITAYNHEKYITQCLQGILNQKGDFQLEIIVGDDCSADNTRKILEEFQGRYPAIISVFPPGKNLGITKNLKRCLDACSGKYIAICEGDDYWTDEKKLQKQMMYLEAHPDLSMCFSAFDIYYEDKNLLEPFADQVTLKKEFLTTEDLIQNNYIGNFSCCMYRRDVVEKLPPGIFEVFTVDWMFNMACGQFGNIGYMPERMSVYRKHSQGAWAGMEELKKLKELSRLIDVYNDLFDYKYNDLFLQFKEVVENQVALQSRLYETQSSDSKESDVKIRQTRVSLFQKLKALTKRMFVKPEQIAAGPKSADQRLQTTNVDLLILDTIFPHPLSPFRLEEFTGYLDYFPKSIVVSTGNDLHLLQETRGIHQVIEDYERTRPDLKNRVKAASGTLKGYQAKLAYLTFMNNVLLFIDILEAAKIPFIFTLYPGGGFALNNTTVDSSLSRIFASEQFRKVIVTQKVTRDYLLRKQFCTPEQIEFIYGVVTPSALLNHEFQKKSCFGINKDVLDICFVAHKYTPKGEDKGYDIFIETAKKLASRHGNINFHVVGGFTESDIPLEDIQNKVAFYGLQQSEWFDRFYADKDIILSPNIPFTLHEGSFDGFPTASCTEAGLRKVAIFCTDELDMNIKFTRDVDIVIVPHNSDKIVASIEYFYTYPEELQQLARRGAAKIRDVYSFENQVLPRIKVIEQELMKNKAGTRHG